MSEILKITKAQTQSVIDGNKAGDNQKVKFFNKGVSRRLEKNKDIVLRQQQLQLNARRLAEKQQAKQGTTEIPKADIKNPVDYSTMDDEKLVSSIVVLGVTPSDLIDGGVDTVRALRLYGLAQKRAIERHRAINTGVQVSKLEKK